MRLVVRLVGCVNMLLVTQKLLILDLDETLIYATETPLARRPDFVVGGAYAVYERPAVREFLAWCLANFEVAVWTSATTDYAHAILAQILPPQAELAFVWTRERCTPRYDYEAAEMIWEKKLAKLRRRGKYRLENVIVIDDCWQMWRCSYGNLVAVIPYHGASQDDELQQLMRYLATLKEAANVRQVEKRGWRQRLAIESGNFS